MTRKITSSTGDGRTFEQLKEHYLVEKELATRLLNSTKDERGLLYSRLYDELFDRVPHHPQIIQKQNREKSKDWVVYQENLLQHFMDPNLTFMEIGAGDCRLSISLSNKYKNIYAIDVSEIITQGDNLPANVEIVISDGCSIPVPPLSVDVAYSMQLMEHLHPEDAAEQVKNIYNALSENGIYLCITPNRLSGPHDISRYFGDHAATGFHLKEYSIGELSRLFIKVGFTRIFLWIRIRRIRIMLPVWPYALLEKTIACFPYKSRIKLTRFKWLSNLLGIKIIARK